MRSRRSLTVVLTVATVLIAPATTAGATPQRPVAVGEADDWPPAAGETNDWPPTAGQTDEWPPTAGQTDEWPPTAGQTNDWPPTAGETDEEPVAVWEMNERPGARTMVDSSGSGTHGRIGSEVRVGTSVSGATGYRFDRLAPDSPPARPAHLVTVPDTDDLDPGNRDFAVLLRLRTTHKFGNIIQKGQSATAGGNFKLQIPSGLLECVFRGSYRTIAVSSPRRLNDGRWHTIRCSRTGDGVTLTVDGARVAHGSGWTGRIANSWPMSIGGKTSCDQIEVGCDYYAGDLDRVEIDAG